MNRDERREFVRQHRTAVLGHARKQRRSAQSIVYYVSDGDDLLVSTMGARAKAKAVRRLGKVSLCVLDEQWPPSYLVAYCNARVESEPDGGRRPDAEDRRRDGRKAAARQPCGRWSKQARAAKAASSCACRRTRPSTHPRSTSTGRPT